MAASFKVEVQTDSTGKWYGNACRYLSQGQALTAASSLMRRWLAVRDTRVVESDDAPNQPAEEAPNAAV